MGSRVVGFMVVIVLALTTSRADAAFHLVKIVEVYPGSPAAPNAQYVVLQMYNDGQNFFDNHTITIYNAAGAELGTIDLDNVANGLNQDKVLIATTQAATFFNVTANFTLTTALPLTGGKVCFETIDCVSWGNYTGTDVGTPWNQGLSSGLIAGRAIARRLNISGSATVLEGTDDTNNSLSDFALVMPAPKNNAGQSGTIPSSTCGNNAVEGIENCDDGDMQSGNGCSSACLDERCGDNVTNDTVETCDDGNATNGDGCDNNCKITACGNGIQAGQEQCDDGNPTDNDGCDSNCKPTGCGNGVQTGTEACDDENLTSGDGCDSNCTITACGNSIVTQGEACEPPNTGTCSATCQRICSVPADCTDTDPCTTNERCENTACVVDPTSINDNEPCTVDACTAAGVTHTDVNDGTSCTLGSPSSRALCLSGTCAVTHCGDSFADTVALGGTEECDDGNSVDSDGCTNACTTPVCGDNIVQTGEQCDDGNTAVNDGCNATCVTELCGDLLQQTSEACDDGNALNDDGCSSTCTVESCGDGFVQVIEECDDGNLAPGDGCSAQCTTERCGDGNLQSGEECDDGNTDNGDACTSTCKKPDDGGCNTSPTPSLPALIFGLGVLVLATRRRRRFA